MFVVRNLYRAAIGKGPQLQAALEERVRLRQSQGLRVNLLATAFGLDSAAFVLSFQHPDLAALEAFRVKRREEPGPSFGEAGLLREGMSPQLWEGLVSPTPVETPPRYAVRHTVLPAVGKGLELTTLMSERARARAAGERIGLQVERAGPQFGALAFVTTYASMADIEANWRRMQGDSASKEYVASVQPLMAGSPTREVFEILIPYPTAE